MSATLEQKEPTFWLLQFPDRLVLVSDEKPTDEELHYSARWGELHSHHARNNEETCLKIIAGHGSLPSVDVTAIAETIGWVDVQQLANDTLPLPQIEGEESSGEDDRAWEELVRTTGMFRVGFKSGFRKSQELNKNKFTEEDMMELCVFAMTRSADNFLVPPNIAIQAKLKEIANRKQQPKQWRVEVEMAHVIDKSKIMGYSTDEELLSKAQSIPRITNNTIKILKVIE